MAYKVFISYSTHDIPVVECVRQRLQSQMVEVFVAEYSAIPGASLTSTIDAAIRNCDLFVLLWSRNSQNSSWVPQEIGHAKGCGKLIVPLVLHPNLTLPAFISDLKYIEVFSNPERALALLQQIAYANVAKQTQNNTLALLGLGALLLLALKGE